MLKRKITIGPLLATMLLYLSGCSLVTPPPAEKVRPVGNDLVINEIFTLPPDRYYAFSWIELYNPTERTIPWFDESFPASLNVVGENGTFLKTENDGKDWTASTVAPANSLNAVDFPYPDTGYVVGDNGAIYRVVRIGGEFQFFTPSSVPATCNMNAVTSVALTVSGYAGGNCGTILRTTTRGQTWVAQNSRTTKNIRSIKMSTVTRIFACGDSGLVLRSRSSGLWEVLTPGSAFSSTHFYSIGVTGTQGDSLWVVGENGTILSSRNTGNTWFTDTTNTTATLRGGHFPPGSSMLAWVVGDNGTILHKTETGRAWEVQNSGTTTNLISVRFADSQRGWVVGENGLILTTTNGGSRWTPQNSGVTAKLKGIFSLPLNIRILNRYVLQMYALRKEFFFDLTTGSINFDYIVRQDTGFLYFDPEIRQQAGGDPPDDIPKNGFVIINSDSLRFQEHTDIGPGGTDILNFSIGFYFDSTTILGAKPVLWDLLQSGEVRLIKQYFKIRVGTGDFLGLTTETVDVVRWGGFVPTVDDFPIDPIYPVPPTDLLFPQNQPAGFIPEWWSLSRYGDDVGTSVDLQNTNGSFYMSDRPVPGYYSQMNKNK